MAFYLFYIRGYKEDIKRGDADIELIDDAIYREYVNTKRKGKIKKNINSIVFYVFLVCITPIFLFAIINKAQGNITTFGNKGLLAVASGSMSKRNPANDYLDEFNLNNQFNTFDIIIVEAVDSVDDLELYDVVTYVDNTGKLIIHRIIEIKYDSIGQPIYITRGDSNDVSDKSIMFERIKGEYTNVRVPFVGALILFFQSYMGIVTTIILVLCLFVIDRGNILLSKEKTERLKKLQAFEIDKMVEKNIYFKGFVYKFSNDKNVDKIELDSDNEYYEESQTTIIKVQINENGLVINKIKIEE